MKWLEASPHPLPCPHVDGMQDASPLQGSPQQFEHTCKQAIIFLLRKWLTTEINIQKQKTNLCTACVIQEAVVVVLDLPSKIILPGDFPLVPLSLLLLTHGAGIGKVDNIQHLASIYWYPTNHSILSRPPSAAPWAVNWYSRIDYFGFKLLSFIDCQLAICRETLANFEGSIRQFLFQKISCCFFKGFGVRWPRTSAYWSWQI